MWVLFGLFFFVCVLQLVRLDLHNEMYARFVLHQQIYAERSHAETGLKIGHS